VTLAPKGLLIEESRTNLLLQSEDFTTSWTNTGTTDTANTSVAPNGTTTADTLTENPSGTGQAAISQAISFTAGLPYTFSIFVKQGTQTFVQLLFGAAPFGANAYANFNVTTGAGAVGTVGSSTTASIVDAGNGWYRCIITATATTTASGSAQLNIIESATDARAPSITLDSGTILLWGAQLESGSFSTSYIPTTTAAATRAADVAVMTGANFSNWYNQAAGSPYFEGATYSTSVTSCGISIDDNTVNNRIQLRRSFTGPNSQLRIVSSGGGIEVANTSGTALGVNKIAAGATASDQAAASNGSLFTGITSITPMPTVTQMQIGSGPGSAIWNGHIRRLAFFPRRLANAELTALTS
jgi:hypothetical protein